MAQRPQQSGPCAMLFSPLHPAITSSTRNNIWATIQCSQPPVRPERPASPVSRSTASRTQNRRHRRAPPPPPPPGVPAASTTATTATGSASRLHCHHRHQECQPPPLSPPPPGVPAPSLLHSSLMTTVLPMRSLYAVTPVTAIPHTEISSFSAIRLHNRRIFTTFAPR